MSNQKKLSVSDFKNWLEGVLDFQEEGWTPNLDQWTKILGKIEELDDSTPVSHPTEKTPPGTNSPAPHYPQAQPSKTRHPRPHVDAPAPPPDLEGPAATIPDEPVIKKSKSLKVSQQDVPTITDEKGTKVINTGKIYKTPEKQEPSAEYESDFI
jgi:hypothetical protein